MVAPEGTFSRSSDDVSVEELVCTDACRGLSDTGCGALTYVTGFRVALMVTGGVVIDGVALTDVVVIDGVALTKTGGVAFFDAIK